MTLSRYAREATKHLAPVPAVSAISGLLRWYKADELALADGSLVSTWPDRSGNGADLTAAGGARPTLAQGRLNGKPGVVFSGAQKLASTAAGQPTGDVTVFAVVSHFKRGSFPQFVSWAGDSDGVHGFNLFGDSNSEANEMPPAMIAKRSGTWGNNEASGTAKPARGDPIILCGYTDGSTTKIRVDKGNEATDSGDSGSIDYGSGTVTLTLGAKAGGSYFEGEIFEVLIFNRTLTPTEIATVEDYLDQKWRVTQDHASFFGLYNGRGVADHYQIGLAWSADGKRWHRSYSNPVFSYATGWESRYVKDPSPVFDGTQYVLFYAGGTGGAHDFQIGRATSTDLVTWTRDSHNPVIPFGAAGHFDEAGCAFPTVILDLDEPDPTRRWKCWYSGWDASGKETIGYAYSSDGVTWTKYGRVLDVGAGGSWDDVGLIPGCVWHADDGTWHLFYGAYQSTVNERFQGGVATFTNPESTYTKYGSNPTIKARFNDTGTSEALTADLAAGARTVTVAATSGFNVHEPVLLDRLTSSAAGAPEYNRILSIDSSTQITLEWPVDNAYPMSDSARIVSAIYNSVVPRAIRQLGDGSFELHVIPFEPTNDVTHTDQNVILREMSMRATIATLTSAAVYDDQSGLGMMLGDVGRWDLDSAENFATILQFVPARFVVMPFLAETVVWPPTLSYATLELDLPFINETRVYGIFSLFDPAKTYSGPGNGGEIFTIRLAPNGITETATLAADMTDSATALTLTGDGSFPSTEPFVVTIGSEVIYLVKTAPGTYRIRGRAMSNTLAAAHAAGATVRWGDSYDMALKATANIDANFTADINSTGSFTYDGWLICFDSSQAYLAGDRYPMHVSEVLGVFDAGAGSSGSNRCDSSQPNAIAAPTGVSDDCPAALSNPALITTDIVAGDVALVRYTNPEATALDLGPRSTALQSWFGLKRVDATDGDVTLTDPDGYVVDTIPSGGGPGPFSGSVNYEWPEPIPLATGIAPDASDDAGIPIDTPNTVPWTTVTLPGSDRYFTYGAPHYSEKGWPMCCLAVRQGNRRIPHWQSWDWHDYGYVYTGFGTDDTFCQLLINRNGIVFDSVPVVELPGPQDIDGPDAVWDDATYYVGASWYIVLFGTPYIVFGPTIGGSPGPGEGGGGPPPPGYAPGVTFPPGGPPVIQPPIIEGGDGGGIDGAPLSNALFQAAAV